MVRLRPTEQRIFDLLKDGMAHSHDDMIAMLDPDELMDKRTLAQHVKTLRDKIGTQGLDVVSRNGSYRLARFTGYDDE